MYRQFVILAIALFGLFSQTYAEICASGIHCDRCCEDGDSCCYDDDFDYSWNIWNMWYFWFIIIFVLLSCFGGCGYWRRRRVMLHQRNVASTSVPVQAGVPPPAPYFTGGYTHTTYGTPGAPPHMAAGVPPQPGAYTGPPAYSEVVSKPDQYPQPPNKMNYPAYPDGVAPYPTMPYPTGPDGTPANPPPYNAAPAMPSNPPMQGGVSPYPVQGAAPYPPQAPPPQPPMGNQ